MYNTAISLKPARINLRWIVLGVLIMALVALAVRTLLLRRSAAAVQTLNAIAPSDSRSFSKLTLLIFKSEKRMEVWGMRQDRWLKTREYPILAASGAAGPKLKDGDRQVPEGIYTLAQTHSKTGLVALQINYPNEFDLGMARREERSGLGKSPCIQGGKVAGSSSLAIGDAAFEDLYALVEETGVKNAKVIIAPNDLRSHIPVKNPRIRPTWLGELYALISRELAQFKS